MMLSSQHGVTQEYISGKVLTLTIYLVNNVINQIDIDWLKNPFIPTTTIGKYLKNLLLSYEQGKLVHWDLLPLNWSSIPKNSFQKKVLLSLTTIKYGTTISYGELATLAGNPCAARAVGNIMSKNPWPLVVPCHRVIGANSHLTGFKGKEGLSIKAWLLHREGHLISNNKSIS